MMTEYIYKTSMSVNTDVDDIPDPPSLTLRNTNIEEIRKQAIGYMDKTFICHMFSEERFDEAEEYLRQRNDPNLDEFYKSL